MSAGPRTPARRFAAVSVVLALVAGLSLGGVSAAAATDAPDVERPDKPRPTQQTGSAAGRPHEVGTDQTRFDEPAAGGSGAPAPNELPPEESLLPVPVESKGHSPEPSQSAPIVQSVAPPQQGPAVGMTPSSAPPQTPKTSASSSYDPATSAEVVAERGERTQVFDNADGSRTLRVSEEPVNFRTQEGRWEPIDTTLVTAPASSARVGVASADQGGVQGGWQTKAGAYPVAIAGAANSPTLATMQIGNGQSAGFGLDGAAPATGRADRDTVTFSSVRDKADLTLQADEGSLKETIHLQSRQSPDTWTFPLALEGLVPSLDEAGNVALKDAAGEVRAVIPAGWMMDSAVNPGTGDGVTSGGVTYALIERAPGAWALKVTLDRAWLDDPSRVYPVKVDPTIQVTPAANSVSIVQGRNYFQTDVYRLGYNCDGGVCNNAAILLNTGSVSTTLKDHLITGTRLNLWNVHTYDCQAPRAVTVHANTAAWNPSTVRYPGPSYGGALGSATFGRGNESDGCGDGWGVVDLGTAGANTIQGWVNGQANHGLTVRTALNDPRTWKKFDTAPNNGVKLDIDYTPYRAAYRFDALVTPVTASQDGVARITVTNTGAATWYTNVHSLHYTLFNSAGQTVPNVAWTGLPYNVGPGGSATLDARIAKLTPGNYTLCWDMDANNGPKFSQLGVPWLCMNLATANQWPVLTSMQPGNGHESATTTPTLTVAGYDPDNYPWTYQDYLFEVCEVVGTDYRANCRSSGPAWQTSPSFTVPVGWGLTKGKTYAWYGYIGDGANSNARPNPAVFTIPNRDPVIDAAWPPNGYTFSTLTPMLHLSGRDTDAWPNQGVGYRFEVCESEGGDHRRNCRISEWAHPNTWTVPESWGLRWAKSYAWYASVGDWGGGAASIARPMFFTTQVPQPAVTSHLASGTDGKEFNVQVGNYTTSAADASVGAVGPELTVRRTYNSMDPRPDSAFGEGWSSRWDMRAIPDSDGSGNVVVVLADGRQVRFGRNFDGSYAAPSGGFATFTTAQGGGWVLADKSGTRHVVDAVGRLTGIQDASGRAQALTYDGTGRLARATDAMSGRYLDFTWSGGTWSP
ncbi:DUF6531 domain-containing protein [Streptomycetaceae bacterium NBC_01309]